MATARIFLGQATEKGTGRILLPVHWSSSQVPWEARTLLAVDAFFFIEKQKNAKPHPHQWLRDSAS